MRLTRVDRYILRQLLGSLVAVTGALVALIWLTQSLRLVELVVNRGLSLRVFLQLSGLLVPNFIAVILPITTFVVVLFVYQRLSGDRELTVLRGAGLSQFSLARPALMLAAISTAAGYLLNLWLVPLSSEAFKEYQFELRNKVAAFLLQEGVFTPISDQLTVYVRSRDTDGTLRGIMVEDDRQSNSRSTILAETGRLVATGNTPRVLLDNGSREEIDAKTGRLNVLTSEQDTIDLASNGKGDEQRFRDVSEMSMQELLNPYPSAPPSEAAKMIIEAHKRLSQPLTAASFTMIGLLAVLAGGFRRGGNIVRPLAAVFGLVGLIGLGLAVPSVATRHLALIPLIYVEAILPGLLCAWVLFLAREGRPVPTSGAAGASA